MYEVSEPSSLFCQVTSVTWEVPASLFPGCVIEIVSKVTEAPELGGGCINSELSGTNAR